MYTVTAGSAVKSATGDALWTNVGYYTLNSVNPDTLPTHLAVTSFAGRIRASSHAGRITFEVPFQHAWSLAVLRLDGTRVAQASGTGPGYFQSESLPAGLYAVVGRAEGASFGERVQVR
jgi:hypothetical protein